VLDTGGAELVAGAFLCRLDAAKANERLATRVVRRHARLQVLLRLTIEVKADLLVESALEVPPAGQ
jgi:hypothetical protein